MDLDHSALEIRELVSTAAVTLVDGHTVEVKNGPAGCSWNAGAITLTCEILFRNLDSNECMRNVRTRFNSSTIPSAQMTGADYIWPGPTINPNTVQTINESGYCITETSPSSVGSAEGCSNTWQDNIPPGAIATQNFVFTNVLAGQYTFYLQIFADYQSCSAPAGMALIPAGCFNLGDAFSEGASDELPVHNVCITSDFYLGVHEVTNVEYAACVSGGGCTAPSSSSSSTRASYYGNPTYNNFPVIYVGWDQATAYCTWTGGHLPTEAQWEYAARGGLAGKRYPWGDLISGANANYLDNDTSPVGNYAANGYGLYGMAGNVWEWVNDRYSSTYYSASPTNDPPGPASVTSRVLRGGSWGSPTGDLRVGIRSYQIPTNQSPNLGFRCAGPDTTRPTVIFTDPAHLEIGVPLNATVNATFSEAMKSGTIITDNFTLTGPGDTPVSGTVGYNPLTDMATFTPSSPLASLTTYTATITTGAQDLAGNGLATNYVWSFTTAPGPWAVDLGAAANFVILAAAAITNTPLSAITGDIGLSPTTGAAITDFTCPEVNGTIYEVDAGLVAICAVTDAAGLTAATAALTTAYNDAAARTVPTPTPVSGDLGGTTLPPGIYKSTSTLGIASGNLTLDANGDANAVWIFQIGSTLITPDCAIATVPCNTGGNVRLINSANAAHVFWQVGSSATIGAYTAFSGTIMAHTSISVGAGADIHGRLLAGAIVTSGAVTLISDIVAIP